MKFIKPQLARPWVERRDLALVDQPGFTMEPKLDGHRVAIIRHSSGVSLVSRRGKAIQPIPWLLTWAQRQLSPGTYLDGELVAPTSGNSSHNVHSLRAHHPELLTYVAFDILYDAGHPLHDRMWHVRRHYLENVSTMAFPWPLSGEPEPTRLYIIETWPRATEPLTTRKTRVDDWLEQGYEGVMYKDMFAPYKPNSRSGWIKEKVTQTVTAIVVSCDAKPSEWRVRPGKVGTDDILYPDGRHTDPWLAGHVNLEYGYGPYTGVFEGKEVPGVGKCTVAGSLGVTGPVDELRELVGQVVTLKCWGVYPSGAVRHPSPQSYRDWDGDCYESPIETMEAV